MRQNKVRALISKFVVKLNGCLDYATFDYGF